MTTIKELYDRGQRQFPMRGGGISPVLEYSEAGQSFYNKEGSPNRWDYQGVFGVSISSYDSPDDVSEFNLLPQPLPDTTAKLEAVVKACEPMMPAFDVYIKYVVIRARTPFDREHAKLFSNHYAEITTKMVLDLQSAVKAAGGAK